jgi:hypothetical protein
VDTSITSATVGNLWGYASGVSAQGKDFAISSSGAVDGLGHANFGNGDPLGGINGGEVTGIGSDANGGVQRHGPYIDDTVVFTFTASNFSLADLGSTVIFQYGTNLSEPFCSGKVIDVPATVPEAGSLATFATDLGAFSLIGLLFARRRRRSAGASR